MLRPPAAASTTLASAWRFPPVALVLLLGCTNGQSSAFDALRDDGGHDAAAPDSAGFEPPPSFDGAATFDLGDASVASSACKAGHYAGTLEGTYKSSLTVVGVPITFTANIDMMLDQSIQGGVGESASFYTIANGTLAGLATLPDDVFQGLSSQLRCDLIGTLDCDQKKLVGGGLRNCAYCFLGALFDGDGGAFYDGGPCMGLQGSFEGPLEADYDDTNFSFVNGTWSATENVPFEDSGTAPLDAGTSGDAGVAFGPGNYGGNGTWGATFVP